MYFPLFVGLSLFCYALLCVHSSFVIILKRKRKLVALLLLSNRCIATVNVLWLFLALPWVGLNCVIVVFPDHTHLLFNLDQRIVAHKVIVFGINKTYFLMQLILAYFFLLFLNSFLQIIINCFDSCVFPSILPCAAKQINPSYTNGFFLLV